MSLDLDMVAQEIAETASPAIAPQPERGRPLSTLVKPTGDDPEELLRHRFLCRGGGLLVVGPTGIGKSSLGMQCKIQWALGKSAFGIEPARPLKSLLIEAENDDGDLVEMRDGVIAGLKLDPETAKRAGDNIIVVKEYSRVGREFIELIVEPMLAEHRPDLLWIDPALAYLGAQGISQSDVGHFLRNLLNPLLPRYGCGCVVVHHTNKPTTTRQELSGVDFAYLGSGSIEWPNWARAVIVLRNMRSHSVFELRAAKRGARLRWVAEDGKTRSYAKLIAHGSEGGPIYWREATPDEAPPLNKNKPAPTPEEILAHVPTDRAIPKQDLRMEANAAGVAINKINPLIAELAQKGILFEWREKRSGTNPRILIARFPQPKPEWPR